MTKHVYIYLLIYAIIRIILASTIELGNDEIYYRLYALYPDWSHFDHPPMIGWSIQLFTFNLEFQHEFFLRLPSIVFGTVNAYLFYRIGKMLQNEYTAWLAMLLYSASIYCSIVVGVFIMPDSPQSIFWIGSMYCFFSFIKHEKPKYLLLFGLLVGLAMLSKYHAVFLWLGAMSYILFHNRKWLASPYLYLSVLISFLCFLPVIYWNYSHDFISMTYHGDRVSLFSSPFRIDFFAREIGGQIFYTNPITWFIIIIAAWQYFIKKQFSHPFLPILFWFSLPIIAIFIGFSMFRATLPHWSGPGYYGLIIIAAIYLNQKLTTPSHSETQSKAFLFPKLIKYILGFTSTVLMLIYLHINFEIFPVSQPDDQLLIGKYDPTMDMYGWRQFQTKYQEIAKSSAFKTNKIITHKWFPAAHLDLYVAEPMDMNVYVFGDVEASHKFLWINEIRGNITKGDNAYYITTSNYHQSASKELLSLFEKIGETITVPIYRGDHIVKKVYLHPLINAKKDFIPAPFPNQ